MSRQSDEKPGETSRDDRPTPRGGPAVDRYHRQALLPQIGRSGQERLRAGRVLLVGCGALGTVAAEQLVRGGVGFVRIVDRDVVEPTNLQRQLLFDEADALAGTPKAVAAAARLARVNSSVQVDPRVAEYNADNAEALAADVDVIVDGTDNAVTRYLINDVSLKLRRPWVYGACVGTEGRSMTIRPGESACLRCVFPDPPGAGELPTCDTVGVLAAAAAVVASMQVAATLKLLLMDSRAVRPAGERAKSSSLLTFDIWSARFRDIDLAGAKRADCPACGATGRLDFLEGDHAAGSATSLCGRDSVQVRAATPSSADAFDFAAVAARLSAAGIVELTPHLLRFSLAELSGGKLTLFPDGRAIVSGTTDLGRARAIYDRLIGS